MPPVKLTGWTVQIFGGVRKVWAGVAEATPEWTDERFEEL